MSHSPHITTREYGASHGTVTSYVTGFIFSILLTLLAYYLVVYTTIRGTTVLAIITGLAMLQLLVQLLFFLHLGSESSPRWKTTVFLFTVLVVGILVFGSLWIMEHLNYHMMSPSQLDSTIINDEGITP